MPRIVETVILNRFKFGVQEDLDAQMLCEMGNSPKVRATHIADGMIIQLAKEIYGKKAIQHYSKSIQVPKNWFEHLKKSIGLEYKKSTIDIEFDLDIYALFPEVEGTNAVIKTKLR